MGFFRELLSVFSGRAQAAPPLRDPVCPSCSKALEGPGPLGSYRCSLCEGLWLDQASFTRALDASEEELGQLLEGTGSSRHTFNRSEASRSCPVCDAFMDNYPFGYQSGIWIDACPSSHGLWLDSGELHMVRSYQQSTKGPMTAQQRAQAAAAMLDGATTSRQNMRGPEPDSQDFDFNDFYDPEY